MLANALVVHEEEELIAQNRPTESPAKDVLRVFRYRTSRGRRLACVATAESIRPRIGIEILVFQ